jgi:hypothetical protein
MLAAIGKYVEAGFDHIILTQINREQDAFFDLVKRELKPALAGKKGGVTAHSVRDDGNASHTSSPPGLTRWSYRRVGRMDCRIKSGNDDGGVDASAQATGGEMFEKDEVLKELHSRLVAAGINPLDPKVQAVSEVINAFYAEKTREVLQKMQEVLSKIDTSTP